MKHSNRAVQLGTNGLYGFWKIMERENGKCFFPGPGEFWGKERILKLSMEKFWIFASQNSRRFP